MLKEKALKEQELGDLFPLPNRPPREMPVFPPYEFYI